MKLKLKNVTGRALPIVAGAIGAKLVKNLAGKVIANDKLRALAPIIVGALLLGSKSKAQQDVGAGMIAVGGSDMVTSFIPSLAGIEDMDLSGVLNGNGDDDIHFSSMSGNDEIDGVLNGSGEHFYGDDDN